MHFEVDRQNRTRNQWAERSMADMTEKAITIIQTSEKGYFLFIEGK